MPEPSIAILTLFLLISRLLQPNQREGADAPRGPAWCTAARRDRRHLVGRRGGFGQHDSAGPESAAAGQFELGLQALDREFVHVDHAAGRIHPRRAQPHRLQTEQTRTRFAVPEVDRAHLQVERAHPGRAGRSHIALLGLCAGRAEEITGESEEPYRTVRVDLLDDRLDTGDSARGKLEKVLPRTVPGAGTVQSLEEQLEKFIAPERIAAALINTCALSAHILPLHKQELLEERSMARRLDLLIEFLERPWQWN